MIVSGEPRILSEDIEENLLRICQEALTNALRHAQATRVDIALTFTPDAVALSVKDNGCGLPPGATVGSDGFGLISMRERSERIGGKLEISSWPSVGTEVGVRVPVGTGRPG